MCGIAGIISKHKETIPAGAIEIAIERMKHRGPDDQGFYCYNHVALGQSRLSIIDIAGGHQPMYSADKRLVLIFNGEIYNYKELTKSLKQKGYIFATQSDSEVLIHLYEEYGEKMLEHLNGMFVFAIYSTKTEELFIARDRLGVKPLYFYEDSGMLAFASEIEGLRSIESIRNKLTINQQALWHYFSLLYVPPPLTIYNEVKVLPGGNFLFYKEGRVQIRPYWTMKFKPEENLSFEECVEELDGLVESSVLLRMQSDVPYGAYLSGGVDSSLVVSKMAKNSTLPVKTFIAQIKNSEFDETAYAELVAKQYKTDHQVLVIENLDFEILSKLLFYFGQPFADSSILPTYAISKKIREYVTVVLGGDGGDELFSGYDKYNMVKDNQSIATVRKAFINRVPEGAKENLFTEEFKQEIKAQDTFSFLLAHPLNQGYAGYNLLRFLDLQFFLQGDILPKLDSMSMANSLEAREPLLDYRIVELALKLPQQFLVSSQTNKVILKTVLAKYFPTDFVYRQKVGFVVPIAEWLKNQSDKIQFVHLSTTLKTIFDKNVFEDIRKNFMSGHAEFGNLLYACLMFSFWEENVLHT